MLLVVWFGLVDDGSYEESPTLIVKTNFQSMDELDSDNFLLASEGRCGPHIITQFKGLIDQMIGQKS